MKVDNYEAILKESVNKQKKSSLRDATIQTLRTLIDKKKPEEVRDFFMSTLKFNILQPYIQIMPFTLLQFDKVIELDPEHQLSGGTLKISTNELLIFLSRSYKSWKQVYDDEVALEKASGKKPPNRTLAFNKYKLKQLLSLFPKDRSIQEKLTKYSRNFDFTMLRKTEAAGYLPITLEIFSLLYTKVVAAFGKFSDMDFIDFDVNFTSFEYSAD
jgi:hypothetical protein